MGLDINEIQSLHKPRIIAGAAFRRLLRSFGPFRGKGRLAFMLSRLIFPVGKVCVPISTGPSMVLDLSNKHHILFYFDMFAEYFSDLLLKLLRPGDVFVDCGANVGYFSYFASGLVAESGRVLAIEANPNLVTWLNTHKECNGSGNVEILGLALWEYEGKMDFHVAKDPMFSSLGDVDQLAHTSGSEVVEVRLETLDRVLQDSILAADRNVRLLKIDVEGAEVMVLKGAKQLLEERRVDFIYVEIHPKQMEFFGQKVNSLHHILKMNGYRCVDSDRDGTYALYSIDAM